MDIVIPQSQRAAVIRAFALVLTLWASPLPAGDSPPLPNIILIVLDTTRADHLGCYGYFRQTSPVIDAFAKEGVQFENAVTPIATTLPAHVSLMTSTHPMRHGIKGNYEHFHVPFGAGETLRTAAQILADLRYATAAIVSATPVKSETGISAGFQIFDEPKADSRVAAAQTDIAVQWIKRNRQAPFFLWVHYIDPHSPYRPPPPFDTMFTTDSALLDRLRALGVSDQGNPRIQRIHNGYDGEIRYVDTELGRLFEQLKASDLYDDAAIVLAGDHGEGLGQHQWIYHGQIYNEQLLVPLIIKFPKHTGLNGQRRQNLTSLIDVLPTLVDTLKLLLPAKTRAQFEGVNAVDQARPREYAFAERVPRQTQPWNPGDNYALMSLEWKYFFRTQSPHELYHMTGDRTEIHNVIRLHPTIAEQMKRIVLDTLNAYKGRGPALRLKSPDELSPAIKEQLRNLGYSE